jgi:cysteinyl-tRNA synthetase
MDSYFMKLYDSYTNKTYALVNKNISIYNCGPTVYNDIHVGNARPLIIFDVLYRYLKHLNFQITYIHNITDIDDKIINKAKTLAKSEKEVASMYYDAYLKIMQELNVMPMTLPKVSENMDFIIAYIDKLVKNNFAYEINGDVYFDVSKAIDYGSISHQNVQALLNGVRKQNNPNKRSPLDFSL